MSAGVLVLHPWWGLNQDVLACAERLRREGYSVVAPDLYHGRVATTIDEAKALMTELGQNSKGAMTEVSEALTKLGAEADRVAVLGWSMGVSYGWQLAGERPDVVRGVVAYYGFGDPDAGRLPPILGHFAEHDEFDSVDDVRSTERALKERGHVAEFHVYPGTKHWLDEPSRPEFDQVASALAWDRTRAFLERRLRP
ncbi:MAG TPA: dienelactone hydrolase family protein [Candidatus Limnocylindria bacterium]|nr:dienelactone hydrolase family protein [Candidatus Limnocylindria bacterium]